MFTRREYRRITSEVHAGTYARTEALRSLKTAQKREAMALGIGWPDDPFVATQADGTPVRPEWYSDEFHRLRTGGPAVDQTARAAQHLGVADARPTTAGAHRGWLARPRPGGVAVHLRRR